MKWFQSFSFRLVGSLLYSSSTFCMVVKFALWPWWNIIVTVDKTMERCLGMVCCILNMLACHCDPKSHTLSDMPVHHNKHRSASLILMGRLGSGSVNVMPCHNLRKSLTKGVRTVFSVLLGSWVPGMMPSTVMSCLYHRFWGRLSITKYMTSILYGECSNGWNQSTFIDRAILLGKAKKSRPFTVWKFCQTQPSYVIHDCRISRPSLDPFIAWFQYSGVIKNTLMGGNLKGS